MSNSPVLYILLIVFIAVILGLANVLGVNLRGTFGNSYAKKHMNELGIDEDEKKEYRD